MPAAIAGLSPSGRDPDSQLGRRYSSRGERHHAPVGIFLSMARLASVSHLRVLPLLLAVLALTTANSFAQTTLNLLGTSTPGVVDSGSIQALVLGVKIFSDVAGQVLGCSFYKSPANVGPHVVSLWDSAGKLLATQLATAETASGKQSVLFSSPIAIAAKQTFTCGYFAPGGHFSYTMNAFTVQKDSPPLHIPVNGGVYAYGTQATMWPTGTWRGSNYSVDVLFSPATAGSTTWISGTNVSTAGSTATVTWNTVVPSDSQVEYGPTTSYGNATALATNRVNTHSAAIGGLSAGSTYHFRVRSGDSDAVLAIGRDYTLATSPAVSVLVSPLNATVASGATQQFLASVSNATNPAVTWSASSGTIGSSGLLTAPTVSSATSVTVTATSQADSSARAFATLTVSSPVPALTVNPTSLSFPGQAGASSPTPAMVSITNGGGGSLTFTGTSDQPWLVLSTATGTAPANLQVSPSITGLKAGTYTAHLTLAGGGATKTVTVSLTLTSPPVQHSVTLSWKTGTNAHVVSYNMYRSTISGFILRPRGQRNWWAQLQRSNRAVRNHLLLRCDRGGRCGAGERLFG